MSAARTFPIIVFSIALLMAALASACGSSEEGTEWARQDDFFSADELSAPAPVSAPTAAPAPAQMRESMGLDRRSLLPGWNVVQEAEVVKEVVVVEVVKEVQAFPAAPSAPAPAPMMEAETAALAGPDVSPQQPAQLVSQRRIIIRTVNMSIVVDQIQAAIDDIARIADEVGGWMVSSDRSLKHAGSVSVRVPASDLDSVVETLRQLAYDVESEISTSQDVTDEYFDLQSRLKNQLATEAALIRLLDRAENVEHALAVQRELSSVQENVERLLGRIKLLEETSAYSLITVSLKLAPVDMTIDAGPDQSVAVHTPARFRATFRPPEGIDGYEINWDFGDGFEPVFISRTAPTTEEGQRITATVTHTYDDPKDSPFIVQVRISGFGESGVAEGEDTLIVSVSEIPVIEVYAGDEMEVTQNEDVVFTGSFTRHVGLTNVRYSWDFGDGSPVFEGEVPEGTRVAMTHSYANFRPDPYRARLTIIADSAVGEVSASQNIYVFVKEELGLIVGGFDVGDTAKTAVRMLSLALSGLTVVAIWVAIFGIIWIPLAVVVVIIIRRNRRVRSESPRPPRSQPEPQAESGPGVE